MGQLFSMAILFTLWTCTFFVVEADAVDSMPGAKNIGTSVIIKNVSGDCEDHHPRERAHWFPNIRP